jgi:hypothetical protein
METFAQRPSPTGARRPRTNRVRTTRAIALAATLCAIIAGVADAADPPKTTIRTCKDAQGRTLITDASDPRCYTAPPTPEELATQDADYREQMERYLACKAAQRSDQTLLSRYPNRASHDGARQKALDGIAAQMRSNDARIEQLQKERKHLLEEAEFYPDGKLPPKLKRDLDSNTALLAARRQAVATQQGEEANINKFYDDELARLKALWSPQRGEARTCVQPRIVKQPEPR